MTAPKLLAIALTLFLTPCAAVLVWKRDVVADAIRIKASEAQGKVLFFTAPSR